MPWVWVDLPRSRTGRALIASRAAGRCARGPPCFAEAISEPMLAESAGRRGRYGLLTAFRAPTTVFRTSRLGVRSQRLLRAWRPARDLDAHRGRPDALATSTRAAGGRAPAVPLATWRTVRGRLTGPTTAARSFGAESVNPTQTSANAPLIPDFVINQPSGFLISCRFRNAYGVTAGKAFGKIYITRPAVDN